MMPTLTIMATILDPTLREYGHKMELEDRTLMMLHTEGFKTMDLARELTVEDVKAMQSKEHYRLVPIMQFKIITKAVQMRFCDPDFVSRLKDEGLTMPTVEKLVKADLTTLDSLNVLLLPGKMRECLGDLHPQQHQVLLRFLNSLYPAPKLDWDVDETSKDGLRILIFGKTGAGKSATGNTILGSDQYFKESLATTSETSTYQCKCKGNVMVMDTMGLYDTRSDGGHRPSGLSTSPPTVTKVVDTSSSSEEEVARCLASAMIAMAPGPHVVLYVTEIGRYVIHDFIVFKFLNFLFGDQIARHMVVVFTHGDQLVNSGKDFEQYIEDAKSDSKLLKEVFRGCGDRYVSLNNTPQGRTEEQIQRLKAKVDAITQQGTQMRYFRFDYPDEIKKRMPEISRRLKDNIKRSEGFEGKNELMALLNVDDLGIFEKLLRYLKKKIGLSKKDTESWMENREALLRSIAAAR